MKERENKMGKNNLTPNSITITYVSKVSFASLNGADKDIDNINPIKKITLSNGQELPYVSSQAIRRALRDKLEEMGWELSEIIAPKDKKGSPYTSANPEKYIDDDLFGYMIAKSGEGGEKGNQITRTSPIRVESLIAFSKYQGDLDFGTNYMGKDKGINPNIYETEIHSGYYKGTILIELDRIGVYEIEFERKDEGKINNYFNDGWTKIREYEDSDKKAKIVLGKHAKNTEKIKRVNSFLDAFQNLWTTGRQSRYLSDISPKFIAAAYMKAKNPVFMEAVNITKDDRVDIELLDSVNKDYEEFIEESIFAEQKAVINSGERVMNLKEGFDRIKEWVNKYYKGEQK